MGADGGFFCGAGCKASTEYAFYYDFFPKLYFALCVVDRGPGAYASACRGAVQFAVGEDADVPAVI